MGAADPAKGEPVASDVELVEVDVPTPGPEQVLVRNHPQLGELVVDVRGS